ncbi:MULTISPECIES: plasmid stabilization protein [Rothia]|uniref:Plasmid stabilization protein n=1 Tax=Rothia nasimurium TaxID=85336 RepID=A0A1Y1RQ78_9MICC|nr:MULTISPECIES: plasmid stabilization protein [Rothia]ORC20229.1 plasmid stabilization protein [Rothia nasimurium]
MSQVGLLLDSDVLAEIRKATPNPQVVSCLRRRSYRTMYISVLSLGELRGLYPYPETERWLAELMDRFGHHVLDVDAQVSLEWAGRHAEKHLYAVGGQRPAPLATAALEGLMAATATVHQLEIISGKAQIYRSWGVSAVDPWQDETEVALHR